MIAFTVNGEARAVDVPDDVPLLWVLREELGLTGTKFGCGMALCGACTVHIDGRRVLSCLTLAARCEGKEVTTIEGVAQEGALHPLQRAIVEHDGLQCGYCTPGQIMAGIALLDEGHATTREEIREWMSGNLCRCGAYNGIVAAIEQARDELSNAAA